jgi:hypothetical protein
MIDLPRFRISVCFDSFRKHRGVWWTIWPGQDWSDEVYEAMIRPPLDLKSDPDLRTNVDITFSRADAEALRAWFKTNPSFMTNEARLRCVELEQVGQLPPDDYGTVRGPAGSSGGFIDLNGIPGFPLDYEVYAQYDLRHAASGFYVTNPDAPAGTIFETANG